MKLLRIQVGLPRTAALTVLEMMVAVTMLVIIMVGLLMMFNQTQKALHIASQQTDVFEAARGGVQMLSRDLAELSDCNQPGVRNCFASAVPSPVPGSALPIPAPLNTQPVDFGEAFWLARANDDWSGVGYFVDGGTNSGIGTLYRFHQTERANGASNIISRFYNFTNSRPVLEGVVHFALSAVYVTNHSGFVNEPVTTFERTGTFEFPFYYSEEFVSTNSFGPSATNKIPVTTRIALPAFVEFEIGVLEPAALKQYKAIANVDVPTAQRFLLNHVGQVHFFRERVLVRNFVNPYRSNEAP